MEAPELAGRPATTSPDPQPALTGVGEMAHPDDDLARYPARHQNDGDS